MRTRSSMFLVLSLLVSVGASALGQGAKTPPSVPGATATLAPSSTPAAPAAGKPAAATATAPPATFVFVPYDKIGDAGLDAKQSVMLPYAEFLQMRGAAKALAPEAKLPPIASIVQSTFRGTVEGEVARFEAEIVIEAAAKPEDQLEIRLPFPGASVQSARVEEAKPSGGAAAGFGSLAPLADGTGLALHAQGEGQRTVKLTLAVPLVSEGAARRMEFGVPRSAASGLTLRVPAETTIKDTEGGLPATVVAVKEGGWEIQATCGSRDKILLVYRPKTELVGGASQARYTVDEVVRLSLSLRGASGQVTANVNVLAGSVESVALDLPPSVKLLNATGAYVKDWNVAEGTRRCTVQLVRPVSQAFDLSLEVQIDAAGEGAENAPMTVPEFRFPDAVRETGRIEIVPDEGLTIWPEEVAGLEAVAIADKGAATRGYRFAQAGWKLSLSRKATPARVRADGLLLYEVTDDMVRLKTSHHLEIGGRGIFGITLQAPEGYELREAGPADLVSGFRQQKRQIEVNFKGEQSKSCDVTLLLQRARTAAEKQVELGPVALDNAEEDAGNVVLALPTALRATELESSGLESTDVRALQERIKPILSQDIAPALGYRYFRAAFKATEGIERQRTRLTCETSLLASIMPSLLRVDATLNYNVEFSATDEFQVLLPASAGEEVRCSGSDIKEKNRAALPNDRVTTSGLVAWNVRLQRRVIGPYSLGVSFDVPFASAESAQTIQVTVPVVRAGNVARETGFVGISRGENLEVQVAKKADELELRDVKELPANLASAFLGFRYFRPEHQLLTLSVVRHEVEPVLGALIRRMHIDTVVSDQREAVHEVFFEVQNNRDPYLELQLPKGMEIWSAFVRGVPVQPTIRQSDGARLIELARSEARDKAFRVRLVLKETLGQRAAMGTFGSLAFAPPEPLKMPVLRMTWKLYLPLNYKFVWFGGTMRQETGRSAPWIEPAAETLLNDFPASIAGGIAQPTLKPGKATVEVAYDSKETEDETRARMQGAALEIPLVKEGQVFDFSRLSGTGTIATRYWKPKPLVVLQGAVALLAFFGVLGVMLVSRRFAPGGVAVLVALVGASLLSGFLGRIFATLLAAWVLAFVVAAAVLLLGRLLNGPGKTERSKG